MSAKKIAAIPNAKSAEEQETAEPFIPPRPTIKNMTIAVQDCKGCDLYKNATQAVFGEGAASARCIIVGEQPGNDEDLSGKPFVGPAGKLLDRGLADAGIDRKLVYVTNAVKHFKNEIRGTRRLHRTPNPAELRACRPWLEAELKVIKPEVLICLGASAARSVMGKAVTIRDTRGKFIQSEFSDQTIITAHPSSILRSPDDDSRHANYALMISDLKIAAKALQK